MSERVAAVVGREPFVAPALFFIASSVRSGDALALAGSVVFLVPLTRRRGGTCLGRVHACRPAAG